MKIIIIIPTYNEEKYIGHTLQSLVEQTLLPQEIIVVNDSSTDKTEEIVHQFAKNYHFISLINNVAEQTHQPGSKVIQAFYEGYKNINKDYDLICKFDADLFFPKDYLKKIATTFLQNPKVGMAGGFCTIKKNDVWELENLTNQDHIRGALKTYRKACFEEIGGLKKSMGWDTVDELLAKYHGWEVITDPTLHVKHLKPTGATYHKTSKYKQGEAFKKMGYGFLLTFIATTKLAVKKRSFSFFINTLIGFFKAKNEYMVTPEEGKFIRNYRWAGIKKKLF